jgi:hypothetical protein
MPVELIARIVDEASVIADLGEPLTRRAADDDIQLPLSNRVEELFLDGKARDVPEHELGAMVTVIENVRGAGPSVDVVGRDSMKAGLPKSFRETARSGKEV